jgi:murein L,D-transpeptidase YcbB/YkuD
VPDQSLDVIDGGEVLLHSRVIIGKKTSPTPILRTEAVAVVANPSWDIPDDIAARALVPHLRQNANYLTSRNMSLMDAPPGIAVDWRKMSGTRLPYQIRQAPGPGNVLGTLMLDSPNDFDVYMHDTPAKALFAQAQRTASNGCVRVEQIGALAIVALGGDKNSLSDALASGETRRLPLAHPLPVYMLYWTAIATPDGGVGFRPDRYGRDAPLLARLDKS